MFNPTRMSRPISEQSMAKEPAVKNGETHMRHCSLGIGAIAVLLSASASASAAPRPAVLKAGDYRADAAALSGIIHDNYAYLEDLPNGILPISKSLDAKRDAVHDRDSLLRYVEDVVASLADHHALTGSSFKDDWAIVPTYADLWIVPSARGYMVDAVKDGSPAARAGIKAGDRLIKVDSIPIDSAITSFWASTVLQPNAEQAAYAARVLAAGRRDRARNLTFATRDGDRSVILESLYRAVVDRPPISIAVQDGVTTIRLNNSLGETSTIPHFDQAMAAIKSEAPIIIDLTDTPSGGTTSVARAIMSWFVRRPTPYQMHQLPAEERETGITRQWVEFVVPREGKYHAGPVQVRVGRWTGSMGEGIAAGFMAIGKEVCGGAMSGLKGAVYDFDLPNSGLRIKIPAERVFTVDGTPRQNLRPPACDRSAI